MFTCLTFLFCFESCVSFGCLHLRRNCRSNYSSPFAVQGWGETLTTRSRNWEGKKRGNTKEFHAKKDKALGPNHVVSQVTISLRNTYCVDPLNIIIPHHEESLRYKKSQEVQWVSSVFFLFFQWQSIQGMQFNQPKLRVTNKVAFASLTFMWQPKLHVDGRFLWLCLQLMILPNSLAAGRQLGGEIEVNWQWYGFYNRFHRDWGGFSDGLDAILLLLLLP